MRLSRFITAPGALTLSLITFASITEDVLARPSPEPKASWVRKGHGRKAISDVLKGKRDNLRRSVPSPSNGTESCVGTPAAQISAPKVNVWAELEDTDAAAVVAWLFSQPEFNLTTTENSTEWDNTV
jgi:primary-amine oxidase